MTFEKVIKHMSESDIKTKFIPLLLKASEETVPNVKFCCARSIYNICRVVDKRLFDEELADIVTRLKDDSDHEVHYWIRKIQKIHNGV